MKNAVLLSIRPEWCDKIASGKKTMEVRKNRPRIEPPFKCYVYATKCRNKIGWLRIRPGYGWERLDGSVIGEFVCDGIDCVGIPDSAYKGDMDEKYLRESCVPYYTLNRRFGHDDAYFWHISNLKIYDNPKMLSDFTGRRKTRFGIEFYKIERAPQSWCYVQEVE